MKSDTKLAMVWASNGTDTFNSQDVNAEFPSKLAIVTVSYIRHFQLTSICGGNSTFASFISEYCSDDPLTVYDDVEELTSKILYDLAADLGGNSFDGSCPGTLPMYSVDLLI